jgi:hypothetical protein
VIGNAAHDTLVEAVELGLCLKQKASPSLHSSPSTLLTLCHTAQQAAPVGITASLLALRVVILRGLATPARIPISFIAIAVVARLLDRLLLSRSLLGRVVQAIILMLILILHVLLCYPVTPSCTFAHV